MTPLSVRWLIYISYLDKISKTTATKLHLLFRRIFPLILVCFWPFYVILCCFASFLAALCRFQPQNDGNQLPRFQLFPRYDIYIYHTWKKIQKRRQPKIKIAVYANFSFYFRLVWVILRSVLMLCIVFGHYTSFFAPWHWFQSLNDGNQLPGCRLFFYIFIKNIPPNFKKLAKNPKDRERAAPLS